jgi:hypothetical protein
MSQPTEITQFIFGQPLRDAAAELKIKLWPEKCENPLRYSAIYIGALALAVYFGPYLSAAIYDIAHANPIASALFDQNVQDVQRWMMLAFGNYGVPILGILTFRYLFWLARPVRQYSLLVAYAWIFLMSAVLSTVGLATMVEFIGRDGPHWDQFLSYCLDKARWSIGPALLCVYINHFMDRQIYPDRPNIESPGEMTFRRIGYAILFTLLIIVLTLPSMPSIVKRSNTVWELSKLRFVAMGTITFITFFLAMAAQFALPKPRTNEIRPAALPEPTGIFATAPQDDPTG